MEHPAEVNIRPALVQVLTHGRMELVLVQVLMNLLVIIRTRSAVRGRVAMANTLPVFVKAVMNGSGARMTEFGSIVSGALHRCIYGHVIFNKKSRGETAAFLLFIQLGQKFFLLVGMRLCLADFFKNRQEVAVVPNQGFFAIQARRQLIKLGLKRCIMTIGGNVVEV